jgi:hypothetical protein
MSAMIHAMAKKQRRLVLVVIPLDTPEEYLVIAPVVAVDDTALEVRRRPVDERDAVLAQRVADAGELVARSAREAHRQVAMLRSQDVDAEMRGGAERR